MTSNPPSSDSQPPTAPARPLAPDAPNGLTSGPESHTGVIRGAVAFADREARYIEAILFPESHAGPRRRVVAYMDGKTAPELMQQWQARGLMALADAENAALTAEADMAETEWQKESDARDQDFADYEAALVAKDDIIAKQNATITERDADVDSLADDTHALRIEAAQLRATIARMRTGRP